MITAPEALTIYQRHQAGCPFCRVTRTVRVVLSAEDYEYGVPGLFHLGQCDTCGLHFQVPRPLPFRIPSFYPDGYVTYVESGWSLSRWLVRRYYAHEAGVMTRLIGASGQILDVGCGAGQSLKVFAQREGWSVSGVEIDARSVHAAREHGLFVWDGRFEVAPLEPESFDLVRMSHYLEHVLDPLANLQRAHHVLKPGGLLYVEIPSIESWDFAFWGRYWGALHFPRHLIFPARRHMRALLARAGFTLLAIRPRFRTCGWSAGIQNFLHDRCGLQVPPVGGRVAWYPLLVGLCLPLSLLQALCGRPGALAYIARKPR